MIEKNRDVWFDEDAPVIMAAACIWNEKGRASDTDIASATGLDKDAVRRSLRRLNGKYLEANIQKAMPGNVLSATVKDFTEAGLVVSGLWPSAEDVGDAVLAELQRMIEKASDKERPIIGKLRDTAVEYGTTAGLGALGHIIQQAVHFPK